MASVPEGPSPPTTGPRRSGESTMNWGDEASPAGATVEEREEVAEVRPTEPMPVRPRCKLITGLRWLRTGDTGGTPAATSPELAAWRRMASGDITDTAASTAGRAR